MVTDPRSLALSLTNGGSLSFTKERVRSLPLRENPWKFNTTGHPGMASGGMGDVLSGICASLIAQGLSIHDAACVGSWVLGRAAELAVSRGQIASESISAPLVAEYLGAAIRELQTPGSP